MSQLVSTAIIVVAAYAAGELGALVSLAAFSGVCFYVGMPLWAAFGLWMFLGALAQLVGELKHRQG